MAIPNIVPRNNNDGETLGTHAKQFSNVHTKDVTVNDVSLVNKLASIDSSLSSNTSAIATLSSGKVDKSGDTMSGNLTISKNAQAEITVKNTNSNYSVSVVAGYSGARGLYDDVNNKWIVYSPNGATTTNLPSNPASTDNSTQIATTNYVKTNLSSYVAKSGDTMSGDLFISDGTNKSVIGKTGCLELYASYPYIDFHFNKSTADYTSRIIESESGVLKVNSSVANASGYIDLYTEVGDNYIKYANGLMLCWGSKQNNYASGVDVSYAKAFTSTPAFISNLGLNSDVSTYHYSVMIGNISTTGCKFYVRNASGTLVADGMYLHWLAIGKWK